MTTWTRRGALTLLGSAAATPLLAQPMLLEGIRGSLDAATEGVRPDAGDDQSRAFRRLLAKASDANVPIFLPPGTYVFAQIELPARTRLHGVAGATRIVLGGEWLFRSAGAERTELRGLALDGLARPLGAGQRGLVEIVGGSVAIVECAFTESGAYGVVLDGVSGRFADNTVTGAAEAAIYAVQSRGLTIGGNQIADCGNGGILVHRREAGEDSTIVSGNRVERMRADHGGTGQFGNGINVYRAGNVVISGNVVTDSAFSAIRSNGGSNVQITGNTCLRSGETAVYSEFMFEGALISSNIVDGAANGISVVNFNEGGRMGVVSGNIVRNMSTVGPYPADAPGFGVGITVEADTAVTGNVVENAPNYGLHLGWGPFLRNIVATGNVIRKAGEGIAVSVVEGSGSVLIADNVIDGAERGAVVGHRWKQAVTGDLASGSDASVFPHLTVGRNKVS